MPKNKTSSGDAKLRDQSRRLHDAMAWLLRGFTLSDPRKSYEGFYLSPQQSYVLTVIHNHNAISPGDVARALRLEKSHLTKIVNSLIELGAVQKQTDTQDRRRLVLTLTSKGKKMYRELDKLSVESYVALMKFVPENERDAVIKSTETLLKAMGELREEIDRKH